MREFLPRELRERIEQAPPAERDRLVAGFQDHLRREKLDTCCATAHTLHLTPQEVERVRSSPPGGATARDVRAAPPRNRIRMRITACRPGCHRPKGTRGEHSTHRVRGTLELRPRAFPAARGRAGRSGPRSVRPAAATARRDASRSAARELLERLRPDPAGPRSSARSCARREALEGAARGVLEFLKGAPDLVDAKQPSDAEAHGRGPEAIRERVHCRLPPPGERTAPPVRVDRAAARPEVVAAIADKRAR